MVKIPFDLTFFPLTEPPDLGIIKRSDISVETDPTLHHMKICWNIMNPSQVETLYQLKYNFNSEDKTR